MSPYVAARYQAEYLTPEDHYELLIDQIVTSHSSWLDVGCGRAPFPNNESLSGELSRRCERMVGIDPDPAVLENPFVHDRQQLTLDEFFPDEKFDLITARMVVEHVQSPDAFVDGLVRATDIGSRVIFFTVNWLSLTAIAAHCTPMSVHNWVKRFLWRTAARDTFPTAYRMNQRHVLRSLMQAKGFKEESYSTLADASVFWRLPVLRNIELRYWQVTSTLRLPYPDSCILAVFQRTN